jgi:hypothetical protein
MMIPVPSARPEPPASVFTTSTTEGSIAAAMAEAATLLLPEVVPPKGELLLEDGLVLEEELPGVETPVELGRRARPMPAPVTPETRAMTIATATTTGAMRDDLGGATGG